MSVTAVNPDDISTNTDVPTKTNGPEYVAFGLVPVFFLLGLLGVLICHALKKKGYRCTTEAEDAEAEAAAEADKELEKDAERGEQSRAEQSSSDCGTRSVGGTTLQKKGCSVILGMYYPLQFSYSFICPLNI